MFWGGLGTTEDLSQSQSPDTEFSEGRKRDALSLRVVMGCSRRNFGVRAKSEVLF